MKSPDCALVGPMAEQVMLGTFHSIAARIAHAEKVGPCLISQFWIQMISCAVKTADGGEGVDIKRFVSRQIAAHIGCWKDFGLTADKITAAEGRYGQWLSDYRYLPPVSARLVPANADFVIYCCIC